MHKILILEDNKKLASYYCNLLREYQYDVSACHDSDEFYQLYFKFNPDLLILDIRLNNSRMNGLDVFQDLVSQDNFSAKVIVLSGEASRLEVVRAMKLGAYTFIDKDRNFSSAKFLNDVKQAINLREQENRANSLVKDKEQLRLRLINDTPFIGKSEKIMQVKERITRFAQSDIDVLIEGETGTGKDIVTKQIYLQSNRIGKPYVVVNSGAMSETLIDSELFGHKKGSFTGAYNDSKGFFEQADSGILFLDEISNLNLSIQAKILRAIEKKEVRVVGGSNKIVDIRLIFATNCELNRLVSEGKFREDLYYRLDGNVISLPPLRERGDDIMILFKYFCRKFSEKHHCQLNLDCSILKKAFTSYHWPGNVRELEKFAESLSVMHDIITYDTISEELRFKKSGAHKSSLYSIYKLLNVDDYNLAVENFNKLYLSNQLTQNNYKISDIADKLGIDRTTLYKKMKKYDITIDK